MMRDNNNHEDDEHKDDKDSKDAGQRYRMRTWIMNENIQQGG